MIVEGRTARRKQRRRTCPRDGSPMLAVGTTGAKCSQSGCTFTRGNVPLERANVPAPAPPLSATKSTKPRCPLCGTQMQTIGTSPRCARYPHCHGRRCKEPAA
jgi:hypothetical protein